MNRKLKETFAGLVYLLPALILLAAFRFLPILFSVRISLYDWGMAGPKKFIGLENYAEVLTDPVFWKSLLHTGWYVFFSVPLMLFIALFIALLLNTRIKGLGIYRTVYYLPVVTSIVAVSIVWKWILHPERGLLNYLLSFIGVHGIGWLEDPRGLFAIIFAPLGIKLPEVLTGPSIAMVALIIMSVWRE
ncbi:MAG: carbohydrate ABC transporter permease [bacterium]